MKFFKTKNGIMINLDQAEEIVPASDETLTIYFVGQTGSRRMLDKEDSARLKSLLEQDASTLC